MYTTWRRKWLQTTRKINKATYFASERTRLAYEVSSQHSQLTRFGGNASPGWRAIEHGLELVKKGIIWRIGNGRSVRVWRDPWLPRDLSRRPITPKNNCRIKWVADLMLDNGMWDANKINQIFLPVDAEIILKLRTSSRDEEDFIAWHPDKLGNFSVRTAYRLAEN